MTLQAGATYATVQLSATQHYHLNSDLVYINHGCDPNLVSTPFSYKFFPSTSQNFQNNPLMLY